MLYKIIDLEQNSPEWHKFRNFHIGGSEAPIICGVSPWSDQIKLFNEKSGLTEKTVMTKRMARGHELEPEARKLLIEQTGINFTPVVLEGVGKYKWISCSLDGISDDKSIMCEIKCPGNATHEMAIRGEIPIYYMYQMQHCLMLSGCEECIYFSYHPDHKTKSATIHVKPDIPIINMILKEEIKFWNMLIDMESPKPDWVFNYR